MIPVMLLMLAGGIALTQVISDPKAVTLRWLRLGGIIAVTLLAVAAVVILQGETQERRLAVLIAAVAISYMVQLLSTQLAQRVVQRSAAILAFCLSCALIGHWLSQILTPQPDSPSVNSLGLNRVLSLLVLTPALASGLLGGFLMTMLLGHAYLTAGNEMTQAPFRRLVLMLAVLLALRTICSVVFGLVPYLTEPPAGPKLWPMMMMVTRYLVGLLVTGAFTYMIYDCVKRRANQSATGILYVATVLIIIGEWTALALLERTGFVF